MTGSSLLSSSQKSNSDPKLPNGRRGRARATTNRNEWLAADQAEKRKSIALLSILAVLLLTGLWLIVAGLSH